MQDSAYLSDKQRRRNVGIRLESVEAVVRNYNRELKIQGENGVFNVYLMLEMLEKEKILPAKALKKRSHNEKQTGPVL